MVLYSYYTEFCPFTQEICPCVFFLICYTDSIINECISKGILSEILRKNRAEVIDMILTEYDENEFREFLKEDSWKKGHTAGVQDGIQTGIQTGIREIIRTYAELQLPKEQLLERLTNGFSLSMEEAEQYIEQYGKL